MAAARRVRAERLIGPQIVYGMRQVPGIVKGRFNRRTDPGEITSYQTLPNFIGLYLLSGVLRRELSTHTRDYANGDLPEVPEAERSQSNPGSTVGPGRAAATTPAR
ncbi:hypothetical protein BJF82_07540 [Kytococcus sp. CUA-901]|nr:hypothetical protein BJF82_07540 [Kytococcus sp. CUA-901]